MSSVDDTFLAASTLGTEQKLELISRIWDSIPPASFRPSDKDLAEMKRRSAEIDSGAVKAIPWEEVWVEVERDLNGNDKR
jgi:putative addiction module component (TIGR02574 family)